MKIEMRQKIEEFLAKHTLDSDSLDANQILDDFNKEMNRGLRGESSSLKMIPAFVSPDAPLIADEPVIVIDAGGTNLRIAVVKFISSGGISIEYLKKYQMPGVEKELSAKEFYSQLVEYLEPVIHRSDRIGFCFSYPAEIYPNYDGRLLHWTKDIKVPEVVGTMIGAGLLNALGVAGEGKRCVLLNDTVATLLAGKTAQAEDEYSSYVGFILGTGTNTAYVEKNSNVVKCADLDSAQRQVINVESGNFSLVPQGDVDVTLDMKSRNPGSQILEKMIAGLYRGPFILEVLKSAAKDKLFSANCAEYITSLSDLTAYDIDMFLLQKGEGPLISTNILDSDRDVIEDIINKIYLRCAKMTALNISAAVLKSMDMRSSKLPVCINIDGSTYYKSVGFSEMTEAYLKEFLGGRGVLYKLMHIDDAPLLGAAVAGLSVGR